MKLSKAFLLVASLCLLNSAFAVSPYVGASVGYLRDSKKVYPTVRMGAAFGVDQSISHGVEIEAGRYSDEEDFGSLKFVPLTLNYRGEYRIARDLYFYVGAGAGVSFVNTTAVVQHTSFGVSAFNFNLTTNLASYTIQRHTDVFTAQGFAGLEYRIADAVAVTLGGRYLWLHDATLQGLRYPLGNDEAIEGGLTFRF